MLVVLLDGCDCAKIRVRVLFLHEGAVMVQTMSCTALPDSPFLTEPPNAANTGIYLRPMCALSDEVEVSGVWDKITGTVSSMLPALWPGEPGPKAEATQPQIDPTATTAVSEALPVPAAEVYIPVPQLQASSDVLPNQSQEIDTLSPHDMAIFEELISTNMEELQQFLL